MCCLISAHIQQAPEGETFLLLNVFLATNYTFPHFSKIKSLLDLDAGSQCQPLGEGFLQRGQAGGSAPSELQAGFEASEEGEWHHSARHNILFLLVLDCGSVSRTADNFARHQGHLMSGIRGGEGSPASPT